MGFERRLMRQAGPFVSPEAAVVAIDMAISDDVDPPGPVGVVLIDAELLLVASGSDGGHLTRIATERISDVSEVEADVVSLRVDGDDQALGEVVLDFRYFGVTDDTINKLLSQFPVRSHRT